MVEVNASDCASDKACVSFNVNVIYDKNANCGKGVTEAQKFGLEENQLQNAKDQYDNADIHRNVIYTAGNDKSKGGLTRVVSRCTNFPKCIPDSHFPKV